MKLTLFLYVIFLIGVGFGVSHAQERGIGITPSKIEIQEGIEWPYTVPVEVFNLSSGREQFEVTFEKNRKGEISVSPGRFSLESGEKRKILVTFDRPQGKASGFIRVATLGNTEDFPTGTGIKIPFSLISDMEREPFIASISSSNQTYGWFPWVLGTGMILVTLFLLWHFTQKIKIFGIFSGVLCFGVLLGVALVNIGYIPLVERDVVPTPVLQESDKEIRIDLTIDYGNGDTQTFPQEVLQDGSTVLDLLESLERRQGVVLQKRNFPGLGVFIEGIHGVHNTNNSYWQFWVNGEYSKVGAGQYVLKEGDRVLWKRTSERE
ncbi:MAG: DUF4430 domain-containing protein [Patescibacteria group bacterium]